MREGILLKKQNENGVTTLKLCLYLISLWILLFMLIVLKADMSEIGCNMTWIVWKSVLVKNIVPCICIILILLGGIGYIIFRDMLKNAKDLPVKIEQCESINYENLSFLATYIIPMVCFPMETGREIFVLFAVIIIIGCIFVKTNLYYTNPSLVLMGFNIYNITCQSNGGFGQGIVIVHGKLKKDDTIKYLSLSDNIYFARRYNYVHKRLEN